MFARPGYLAVAVWLVKPRPLMPRLLASVNWKVTTGGLATVTLVTAPTGASAAKSAADIVAASIGVPLGGGTFTLTTVPPEGAVPPPEAGGGVVVSVESSAPAASGQGDGKHARHPKTDPTVPSH